MMKKSYVKPCTDIVHVVGESLLLANSVVFGDEHDDIDHSGNTPSGGYIPGGGETGVVHDPNNPTGSKGYNVWDSHL